MIDWESRFPQYGAERRLPRFRFKALQNVTRSRWFESLPLRHKRLQRRPLLPRGAGVVMFTEC